MYNVNVYQTDAIMAITDCKRTLSWEQLFSNDDELFQKIAEEKFLYIFHYGMVGFFNPSQDGKNGVCSELRQLYEGFNVNSSSKELNIVINKSIGEVSFNKVALPYFDRVSLKKVLLTIIQSATIEKYLKITEQLWDITTAQNAYLRANGKLSISQRQLKMHFGSLWSIKNKIMENRKVFNTAQEIYGNMNSKDINIALKKTVGHDDSMRKTTERLEVIQENLELFKAILDQKESSRLEWIIILLIAVEIVDLFVLRFFKWLQ